MATKASENKSLSAAETKTETPDFLSGFEGKSLSVATFEEAHPGRGREIFDTVSRAGKYGYFPSGANLGMPQTAEKRRKVNEAVAKLNLGAK